MAMPYTVAHVDDAVCHEPAASEEDAASTTRPFATLKAQMEKLEKDTNIE